MKLRLLKFSFLYTAFYLVIITVRLFTDLTFSSITLGNIMVVGIFVLPLIPFVWFNMVKIQWVQIALCVSYSPIMLMAYYVSMLAIIFAIGNLFSANDYRKVFEAPLSSRERLVIYRSPDKGAFGGDDICFAIVKSMFPGVISRSFLSGPNLKIEKSWGDRFVIVEGVRIKIPDEEKLSRNGRL